MSKQKRPLLRAKIEKWITGGKKLKTLNNCVKGGHKLGMDKGTVDRLFNSIAEELPFTLPGTTDRRLMEIGRRGHEIESMMPYNSHESLSADSVIIDCLVIDPLTGAPKRPRLLVTTDSHSLKTKG